MNRRIVTLTHEFFPYRGGIATWVQSFANAAVHRGHDIEVWCPDDPALDPGAFAYRVRGMPVPGGQSWRSRIALGRHLAKTRPDWQDAVLLLPEPGPIRTWMYLQMTRIRLPERVFVVLHGTEILRFTAFPHRRALFRRLLHRCERIGVVSEHNRRLLIKQFPALADRTVTTYGAVQDKVYEDVSGAVDRPASDKVVLLTVGRISPRKGQMEVIEALGRLPIDLRHNVVYRVVGPTNSERYLRRLRRAAHRYRVSVEFTGAVPDAALADQYRRADIFIMASRKYWSSIEGFGLVYLEAGIHGLPVIAHRTGGVEEAVLHERTGLLVEPHDRDGLAAAIERLAGDRQHRTRLGMAGRQWALSFSWQKTVDTLFGP